MEDVWNIPIKKQSYPSERHLRNSCCMCCPAARGCSAWCRCGRHTWSPTLCCQRIEENGEIKQTVLRRESSQENLHHLRLMLCNWDPGRSSCCVPLSPPDTPSLFTAEVMSCAQSSLSSREQASRKWSAPLFVWSLITSWENVSVGEAVSQTRRSKWVDGEDQVLTTG